MGTGERKPREEGGGYSLMVSNHYVTISIKVNLTAGLDDSKSGSSCHVAANWRATTARGFPPANYM